MGCNDNTGFISAIIFIISFIATWFFIISISELFILVFPLVLIVNTYASYKTVKFVIKYFNCIQIAIFSTIFTSLLCGHYWALDNFYARGQDTGGMCASNVLFEVYSPNKNKKAIIFTFDCGATTDFNTVVAIADANDSLYDIPKSYDVYCQYHKRNLQINWLNNTKFEIIDPVPLSQQPLKNSANGVDVVFK